MNNFSRGNTQLGMVWGKRDLTFKAELPPNEPSKSSQVKSPSLLQLLRSVTTVVYFMFGVHMFKLRFSLHQGRPGLPKTMLTSF